MSNTKPHPTVSECLAVMYDHDFRLFTINEVPRDNNTLTKNHEFVALSNDGAKKLFEQYAQKGSTLGKVVDSGAASAENFQQFAVEYVASSTEQTPEKSLVEDTLGVIFDAEGLDRNAKVSKEQSR